MTTEGYNQMIALGNATVIDPNTIKPESENGFCDAIVIPFYMDRLHDPSNVSGTGIVAQGMISLLDGKVYTIWQSDHPSYTVHESLQSAVYVHGHGNSTRFLMSVDDLSDEDRINYLPVVFELWHDENRSQMTRIGLVGRGVLTNNGGVIYRWLVTPYQVEFFQSWESFKAIHIDNHDYVTYKNVDCLAATMPQEFPIIPVNPSQ